MTPPLLQLRRQLGVESGLDGACAYLEGWDGVLAQGRMEPDGPFGPGGAAG